MSRLSIHQIPILDDNYTYILHDEETGKTAVVDPGVSAPVLDFLRSKGWPLHFILNTHHHNDHIGGNLELKATCGCEIVGPKNDAARIPGISILVQEGDVFELGNSAAQILEVPGHTRGHIAYYFASASALFSGDVIFSLGGGFLFEGTPEQMWNSLEKIRRLPHDTKIYGAHEYTLGNARYAIRLESENPDLQRIIRRAELLRSEGKPTVPTTLGEELSANPFLRPESAVIQQKLGMENKALFMVYGAVRQDKDKFDRA